MSFPERIKKEFVEFFSLFFTFIYAIESNQSIDDRIVKEVINSG